MNRYLSVQDSKLDHQPFNVLSRIIFNYLLLISIAFSTTVAIAQTKETQQLGSTLEKLFEQHPNMTRDEYLRRMGDIYMQKIQEGLDSPSAQQNAAKSASFTAPSISSRTADFAASANSGEGQVPDADEFDALSQLYQSLNGDDWDYNTNWLQGTSAADFATWYNVVVRDGDVVTLYLVNNNLKGSIPPAIRKLKALEQLVIVEHISSTGYLSGSIPSQIGELTNLKKLQLGGSAREPTDIGLTGTLPGTLGNLVNLEVLTIFLTNITGEIPTTIQNLTKLKELDIDGNLSGAVPDQLNSLTQLTTLGLGGNQFSSFPSNLSALTNLSSLNLSGNQSIQPFPSAITSLTKLETLNLSYSDFTGSLPSNIGNLGNLTHLVLHENEFSGALPPSVTQLNKLQFFNIQGNQFSGTIPANLRFISSFKTFYLEDNEFTFQQIQPFFTGVNQSYFTTIRYTPQASVELTDLVEAVENQPITIAYPGGASRNRYRWQKLIANTWQDIVGATSQTLQINQAALSDAGMYQCVVTNDWATQLTLTTSAVEVTVEESLLDPQTQALHDFVNSMSNPNLLPSSWDLTDTIASWEGVVMVDGWVTEVALQERAVGGSIPSTFENLEKLERLNLTATGLTGSIPTELGTLVDLTHLQLGTNNLSGPVPASFADLTQLESLNLSKNNLTGDIPDLSQLDVLHTLQLQNNQLSGGIPTSLSGLDSLRTLRLNTNPSLGGSIPESLAQLPVLEKLYLGNSGLTDTIPSVLSDLDSLLELDLSGNLLEGEVPSSLDSLKKLTKLHLHQNNLTYLPDFTAHPNAAEMDIRLDGNRLPLADIAYNHTGENAHPFKEFRYAEQQEKLDTIKVTGQVFTEGRDVALRVDLKEHPQHQYRWQKKDGGNWVDVPGGTERSLLIADVTEADISSEFRVLITNLYATLANARSEPLDPEGQDFHRYVRVYTPRVKLTDAAGINTTTTVDDVSMSTDYIDGLGRTVQSVSRGAGGTASQDVVQFYHYDALGRVESSYLPYATDAATGAYRPEAEQEQNSFYKDASNQVVNDNFPFSATRYETSPLSRVLEQGAPGQDWQLGAHTMTMDYRANTATDAVSVFTVSGTTINRTGTYPEGELAMAETTDENGHYVRQFTDKQGQTVLKRVQGPGGNLDTYSVYDDRGRLRFIIPPQAVTQMASAWSLLNDVTFREQWVFVYDYDALGRISAETVPGGGTTRMIYDRWGRLVYSQTPALRQEGDNRWTFTKYDYLDRPVVSGVFAASETESTLRAWVLSTTDRFESRTTANATGYTLNNSHPKNVTEATLRTVSYYDNYSFPSAITSSLDFTDDLGSHPTHRSNMKGELTGSLTRNLANDAWLGSVIYYDDYYRPIVAVTENHLGGIDRITTRYTSSVLDEVEETFTTHITTAGSHTVRQAYDYDHQGRLLTVAHQLDNQQPAVTLASYAYNELGQLVQKELNADAPTDQVSQTVDYRYHVRGWLKGINDVNEADDYFSQELVYERGGNQDVVQFNGNVTDQYWRNWGQDEQSYQYKYDEADRLTNAVHSGHYSTKSISYDGNGNITELQRFTKGATAPKKIDFLQYSYHGNRLTKVKERSGGEKKLGFVDGVDNNNEYGYDAAGNLVRDDNKGITNVTYDPVLNLPLEVSMTNGTLRYGYDAAGNKLWQQVVDAAGNEVVTTDYVGAFEYSNSTLSLVHHGEGRIYFPNGATTGTYHFDLTDHLGNVRATFSPEPIITRTVATMEADAEAAYYEESFFTNMDTRRMFAAYNTTPVNSQSANPQYVADLNAYAGTITGPARSLVVRQGDKVRLQVQARYEQLGSETTTGTAGVAAAVLSAFGASAGVEGSASYQALSEALAGSVLLSNDGDDVPHAYLNYLLFDENFDVIDSGMVQATQAGAVTATTPNAVETLVIPEITASQNGYLYTYLSNESNWNVSVYFDDFVVEHQTHLVQVNDYYPFGARHDQSSYIADQAKYGYQGKELQADLGLNLLDFHARQYDPILGRFTSYDPAGQFASGYVGMGNNPVLMVDPNGELAWFIWAGIAAGAYIGGSIANEGELNPVQWNYTGRGAWQTYVGIIVGGTLGGIGGAAVGGLWTGTTTLSLGVATPVGKIGATLAFSGGSGTLVGSNSNWFQDFNWSTNAGGSGSYDPFAKPTPPQNLVASLNGDRLSYYNQNINPDFYYEALDGLELPNRSILFKNDFYLTFYNESDFKMIYGGRFGNANYIGYINNQHHINFNITAYEVTADNIRAVAVHEVYGHGIKGYGEGSDHYLAYIASMRSIYWDYTTEDFKINAATGMWNNFGTYYSGKALPSKYMEIVRKYARY